MLGSANLGLISGFIAQPGACKMVTFYCFLAFSLFLVSVTFLPFLIVSNFHLRPQRCKGCACSSGTHSSHRDPWCLGPSLLSSSPPSATGYGLTDPSSRVRTDREAGRVVYLLPHPMANAPLPLHFSGRQQWLTGISGVSLPLCPPAPSNPVLNADPQLTFSLNNTAFSHLQNGCCKSLCLLPLTLGWKKSEQKVLIPILMRQKCLTNSGFCCCPADVRNSHCRLRAPALVAAGKSRQQVWRGQAWRDAQ